jgi:hypothetical protein
MSKRFIDTEIFCDSWFMDLSINAKLLYIYLITNCDHAGIIDFNLKLTKTQTGIEQLGKSWGSLRQELGKSLIKLKDNYYYLTKFIKFQYPGFPKSKVNQQLGAIKRLKEFNLWDEENQCINEELVKSCLTLDEVLVNCYDNDNGNEYKKEERIKKESKYKGNCLMKNSGIEIKNIKEAFLKTNDLKEADPEYYFNVALDWSNSKDMMRSEWISTVRNFARKDIRDGKLKLGKVKASMNPNTYNPNA